jgi:putative flippase GtrA
VISRTYNLMLKAVLGNHFSDAQCGFKAVRNDVAHVILPLVEDNGWFFDTELLVLAEHNGLRIHEIPVDWVDDPDSRVRLMSTAADDLRGIWRMRLKFATGGGRIPDGGLPRSEQPAGLAGQIIRFASVGAVTTLLFASLFVALAPSVGPITADVVALAVGSAANIAANCRVTFAHRGRAERRRHYLAGLAVNALPLVGTVATLMALGAAGVRSIGMELVGLTVTNAAMTAVRFVLLRYWLFGS